MIERLRRWWDAWVTRELKETRPGGFPQAVFSVNYRHPRARLVHLLHPDPAGYVYRVCGERERAYRRREYTGEW